MESIKALYESYIERKEHPFIEAANSIKDRYCEVVNEYTFTVDDKLAKTYLDFSEVDDGEIIFRGDEYWRYGGHEHHSLGIPEIYFTDTENAFESLEAELKERFTRLTKEKEDRNRKLELQELERLTKKYKNN